MNKLNKRRKEMSVIATLKTPLNKGNGDISTPWLILEGKIGTAQMRCTFPNTPKDSFHIHKVPSLKRVQNGGGSNHPLAYSIPGFATCRVRLSSADRGWSQRRNFLIAESLSHLV